MYELRGLVAENQTMPLLMVWDGATLHPPCFSIFSGMNNNA